ncbi:MAG: hypothetical protein ACI8RD_000547 [Bacillariaceae sp.]|jgi:hypothetical protein
MDNKVTTGEKTREERAIFERKKTQRQFDQDDDKLDDHDTQYF